jgi:stage II sporulation protein P
LEAKIEMKYPGLSRGIFLQTNYEENGGYNQNLSDKALLIQIGGVGNTMQEENRTADALGIVIKELLDNNK